MWLADNKRALFIVVSPYLFFILSIMLSVFEVFSCKWLSKNRFVWKLSLSLIKLEHAILIALIKFFCFEKSQVLLKISILWLAISCALFVGFSKVWEWETQDNKLSLTARCMHKHLKPFSLRRLAIDSLK